MACLSKLDRQLKDLEEKLKYILIIRQIRRRRVLRDKKPRKAWVREIYNNRSAYMEIFQRYSKNFMPTESYFLNISG